jgi:two-component system, OmpR family, response regulator RpaA
VSPHRSCLFVDDDPGLRELIALNLAAEGIDVHVATSGVGIEEIAENLHPDIVLLDIMMPGRDGYQVLAALKASEATRYIPVVLLTAKATDAEVWQGWQAGADYYLTKPFNIDELIHYIEMIFAEHAKPATPV